jgi:hypothetical protein
LNWKDKVHPFFLRSAEHNKKTLKLLASANTNERREVQRLVRNPPAELIEEAHRMHDAQNSAERDRANADLAIYGIDPSQRGTTVSEAQFMQGWFAWSKYRRTLEELVEGDAAGDEKSSKQLMSVMEDFQKWRYGKLDPNKMKFKTDSAHTLLMSFGLDLGIQSLSPGELADCFDEYCTSCMDGHDAENLTKLRNRLVQQRERLISRTS